MLKAKEQTSLKIVLRYFAQVFMICFRDLSPFLILKISIWYILPQIPINVVSRTNGSLTVKTMS